MADKGKKGEGSTTRRKFLKAGVVLLPYVAPAIESIFVSPEESATLSGTAEARGVGRGIFRGRGRGRGRFRGRRPTPPPRRGRGRGRGRFRGRGRGFFIF